jgi:hypothetical protein
MIAGVGYRAWFGGWSSQNMADLKIWLFARSEEAKNIKIHVRKLGKLFHVTNCKNFYHF